MTMSDEIAINEQWENRTVEPPCRFTKDPFSIVATFLGDCNLIDVIVQNVAPDMVTLRSNLGTSPLPHLLLGSRSSRCRGLTDDPAGKHPHRRS